MALLLIGCGGFSLIVQTSPTAPIVQTRTLSPLPSPTETATVGITPSPTDTITVIPSPTVTFTSTPTLELQWSMQGPGDIRVPILLYHNIGIPSKESQYYISPEKFEEQMELLYKWGYRTISVELLVHAIREGAELPARPIILTFDDGSEGTLTTALPILQECGFTGTAYIVYNYIGAGGYLGIDQIRELYASGWEIGSHSLNHVNLTERTDRQQKEIVDSRRKLQDSLGLPVLTFAYPFGAYDEDSVHYTHDAGYIAAMGLGADTLQGERNLFYLYRREIKASYDLQTFGSFLPWQTDVSNLPMVTIVP